MTHRGLCSVILALLSGGLLTSSIQAQETTHPELVEIGPGVHQHRASGEFLNNGRPVEAPQVSIEFSRTLHIMKYQVSNKGYADCVADHICGLPYKRKKVARDNKPVTGVSFSDAQTYASWLTAKTGIVWRLPSDAEWAYSAGSRFFDDGLETNGISDDPSVRMLAKYQQVIDLNLDPDPVVKPIGTFGANENGVYDQSGNVWEWTSTCYRRSTISNTGELIISDKGNCGVRVVEGRHRSYMTFFIQDAKTGGCAVGTPPDHLGFRLVRDNPPLLSIRRARNWWTYLTSG